MIAIANFIGLPLFFLSSTLISLKQMPEWMQELSRYNPVNWGVVSAREVVLPGSDWSAVGVHLGLLFALTVATAGVRDLDVPGLPAAVVDGAAAAGRQAEFCEIRQMTWPVLTA